MGEAFGEDSSPLWDRGLPRSGPLVIDWVSARAGEGGVAVASAGAGGVHGGGVFGKGSPLWGEPPPWFEPKLIGWVSARAGAGRVVKARMRMARR